MTARRPVRATKVRQTHSATAVVKPGKPHNGANFVAQRDASTKKNAARSKSSRSKKS